LGYGGRVSVDQETGCVKVVALSGYVDEIKWKVIEYLQTERGAEIDNISSKQVEY
jgi:hypothetical protein